VTRDYHKIIGIAGINKPGFRDITWYRKGHLYEN